MSVVLEVSGLSGGYGPLQVLRDVTFEVGQGESVVLLGPNGAGKTTLLKTLIGLQPRLRGEVIFQGRRIEGLRTDRKVRLGISFMTEKGIFTGLSVEENLLLGGYGLGRRRALERIGELIGLFPDLARLRRRPAGSLSGGQRKMLAVARALVSRPRLVVMDEPSAGLSPLFVSEVVGMLARFRTGGSAFLVAEQNVAFLEVADRVYILDDGRIRFSGTVDALRADRSLREAYFGVTGD